MPSNILLIVDDDFINRQLLKNIFSPFYSIEEAESGAAALEILNTDPLRYCAIFLDVIMPGLNGIDLLRVLSERKLTETVPVFLITAHASEDKIIKEAYELGVMDVISKPVMPYIVLRRVNTVVELFRSREQLSHLVKQQQIELSERTRQVIELNRGMFESLSAAIEFRDVESGEHVNRIHNITRILLSETEFGDGLTEGEIDDIAIASVMHDVGKIAIPDAILNKPGRLTSEEYDTMKTHTLKGAQLLENISSLHENSTYTYALDIARHHHERWDGNGYPDRLRGDEISIWAQAVSIADVYDALISPRVYKKAYDIDTALSMIFNGECGVFNPHMLDCFMSVEPKIRIMYQ
ncbi:MAG: response regulator [Ruminococcaceae bacterium]|nr:response regulator [Oscillospiraceae bacterium]